MAEQDGGSRVARWARVGLGIAVAGGFAWLLFVKVDLSALVAALAGVDPARLIVAVAALGLGFLARGVRWWLLLRGAHVHLSLRSSIVIFVTSFGISNVIPLRAGDVYRTVSGARLAGARIADVLATLVVERLLDVAALVLVLAVALRASRDGALPLAGQMLVNLAGAAVTALIFAVILLPRVIRRIMNVALAVQLAARHTLTQRLRGQALALGEALERIAAPRLLLPIVLLTGLGWLLELSVFGLAWHALGHALDLGMGFFAGTLGTLATLLPGTPGHFGTLDYFVTEGFMLAGADRVAAVSGALLAHFLLWAPVTLASAAFLLLPGPRSRDPLEAIAADGDRP
jgi:uncharacterized protein (TIRG00374 family)